MKQGSAMRNMGSATSIVGAEMGALRDDELDVVNGGKKSATDRARSYDNLVRDKDLTDSEYWQIG
jgi:hypothetical protein